ncbi:unnamed protein product, partial [Rotaria magnacalcarata]
MSSCETINIPNHIRNIIPSRIIIQYYQFCKETCPDTFKPLGKNHCSTFSLNDPSDKDWHQSCDHHHDDQCEQCSLLDSSFQLLVASTKHRTSNCSPDRIERLVHRMEYSFELIYDWKSHVLRTIRQDGARSEALDNLDSNSIMICKDWVMKFLVKEHCETQRQWF